MTDEKSIHTSTLPVSEKLQHPSHTEFVPEIPQDIIYPNELNIFLREQLRYYVQKSGLLEQNLSDLEARFTVSRENIKKLEAKLESYEGFNGKTKFATSSQLATSKIIELSKKLREKNSEVESLKTKCSKIEKVAFDLKQQLEDGEYLNVKECNSHHTPPNSLSEEEIKRQNEKVSSLKTKLSESQNLNLQLKNEIKLAKKIIQQETGENFDNLQILNSSNGWRGRAQQILDLQKKNTELKEKLKAAQVTNPVELVPVTTSKIDNQLAVLTKENEEIKSKYEDLKKKQEALKARYKVVDTDYSLLKSKSAMLKEQATRDQEIITSLLAQLNSLKEIKHDAISQKERTIIKLQTEKKQCMQEIEEYKSVIKSLRVELKDKENKFDQQSSDNNGGKKTNLDPVPEPCETQKQVLDLFETANQKLNYEREAHIKTQLMLKVEKQKVVKAEAALARLDLESSTRCGYSSMNSVRALDCTLKDQLELAEERIKALQTRLEIEQMERKNDLQQFGQIIKTYEAPRN